MFDQEPFLKTPDIKRARKPVFVYIQDRGFKNFAVNMIRLLVNKGESTDFFS